MKVSGRGRCASVVVRFTTTVGKGTLPTTVVEAALSQKGAGVTGEDEEVRRVLDAIDELGELGDATDRARRLTQLLDQWPDTHSKVSEMRQQAVQALKDQGLSLRKIGELIGVSHTRVRQILAGETANPRKRKPPEPEAGE